MGLLSFLDLTEDDAKGGAISNQGGSIFDTFTNWGESALGKLGEYGDDALSSLETNADQFIQTLLSGDDTSPVQEVNSEHPQQPSEKEVINSNNPNASKFGAGGTVQIFGKEIPTKYLYMGGAAFGILGITYAVTR